MTNKELLLDMFEEYKRKVVIELIKDAQKKAYNEAITDAAKRINQTAGQWNSDFCGQVQSIIKLKKP